MIIDDVKEVISKPFGEVVASPLSLKLLRCYSLLYMEGKQPRTCTNSQRTYYQTLLKNGIEMAQKYEEAKKRICKPAWNGLKYIPPTARHWNSEWITDEEALKLLDKGWLKESDFEVLPEKPKPLSEEEIQEVFKERHAPKKPKSPKGK